MTDIAHTLQRPGPPGGRLAVLSGRVLLAVGFAARPGALGFGGRWPDAGAPYRGNQGDSRAEQDADSKDRGGKCRRDAGDGSLVPALLGKHPLGCWHVLAAVQPAERLQHPDEMGIRPDQAGFDAAELALLAIAEAHRRLLTCGLLRTPPRVRHAQAASWPGSGSVQGWPGGDQGAGPGGGSRARARAVSGRPGARWPGLPPPGRPGIRRTECWTSTAGWRRRTWRPGGTGRGSP